jgi:membrane protease YdiL (CAAX protease family)
MTADAGSSRGWVLRAGIFALLLVCGLLVFVPAYISSEILVYVRLGTALAFLASAILLRRSERFREYWQIPLALGTAATAMFITAYWNDWLLGVLNVSQDTAAELAITKLSETVWICLTIVAVTVLFGVDMGTIFLKRGKLKQGLLVGLIAFLLLSVIATVRASTQNITFQQLLQLSPWILIFVLANGFLEELLYRGLFLKRYEPVLGRHLSNLVTALVFVTIHAQVTYTPDLLPFLIGLFFLAMLWGALMQRTDSVIGSALFHAGADTLIILGILADFGISF